MQRKNLFFRKSGAYIKQIPRWIRRVSAKHDEYYHYPPVLANSFPKSGTHLLLQILKEFPNVTYYGSFIASRNSSVILRERSTQSHLRLIGKITPGEVLPAHIFHSVVYENEFVKKNCTHYFIYRDLRDCVVSETNYITNMNRWHRLNHFYTKCLESDEERISAMILANQYPDFPCDYPNIGERFMMYYGWLDRDVLAIRFESLMSKERDKILDKIVGFYIEKTGTNFDTVKTIQKIKENLIPQNSHTFWKGKVGGWRDVFTERHKDQFKSVAGELLIRLGYEENLDW